MNRPRLTVIAHTALARILGPGDLAIDATLGNGHDTGFLVQHILPGGHLIGFDIQQGAIDATRRRLHARGAADHATLIHAGHQHMCEHVPADWHGAVAAVMFNLGYLPGADKSVITQSATTCAALDQAVRLLRTGGLVSVVVYPGHAEGANEAEGVAAWLARLPAAYRVHSERSPGPVLHLIERTG